MRPDVLIVGGGIAGASLAYELATTHEVILAEREDQFGYHTTGRSAALFLKSYGNAAIRALTVASETFYVDPPAGFATTPLLSPRGELWVARADQLDILAELTAEIRREVPEVQPIAASEIRSMVPAMRADYVAGGLYDRDARDMDVDAILQGFLRGARQRGARLMTGAELHSAVRTGDRWQVRTAAGNIEPRILVNAAGAWGDVLAGIAGVRPIGLEPKRRTAFLVQLPDALAIQGWPGVSDVGEQWYVKPDAGRLLCSPADETDSEPMDAWADDFDVATAAERIQQAMDIEITRIARSWAGLRTFSRDRTLVAGFDPMVEGFFWLVGQGGYGIQTAPAMSRTAADLVRGTPPAELDLGFGFTALNLSPGRFGA